MKSLQLKVKQKRKFKVTTDSNHKLPVATNVLNREFSPSAPNQAWGSDITKRVSRRTEQGSGYLAVIIDPVFSPLVEVGWSIDRRMKKALVIRALSDGGQFEKANRRGLIHHSDFKRCSQYASHDYQKLLKQIHGMICSMSLKGNCWDNYSGGWRFFSAARKREMDSGDHLVPERAITAGSDRRCAGIATTMWR